MAGKYILANDAGMYTQKNSTTFQVAGSSGLLYSEGKAIRVATNVLGSASTVTNIPNYGISSVTSTTGLGKNKYTLAAPEAGIRKTIFAAAANSSDYPIVDSGSTAIFFISGSSDVEAGLVIRRFLSLKNKYATASLVATAASIWLVESHTGVVALTAST